MRAREKCQAVAIVEEIDYKGSKFCIVSVYSIVGIRLTGTLCHPNNVGTSLEEFKARFSSSYNLLVFNTQSQELLEIERFLENEGRNLLK